MWSDTQPQEIDLTAAYMPGVFPGVKFLVTPDSAQTLEQELAIVGRPAAIPDEERAFYATRAAALLAQIASQPNSPFEPDLARIEPALAVALNVPATSLAASAAAGGCTSVPGASPEDWPTP